MLVRAAGLADTMSRYLIRRIEENPAIALRTNTEIVGARRGRTTWSACAGATTGPADVEELPDAATCSS